MHIDDTSPEPLAETGQDSAQTTDTLQPTDNVGAVMCTDQETRQIFSKVAHLVTGGSHTLNSIANIEGWIHGRQQS